MSIEDKIRNAKPSDWLTKGIPKWQVKLITRWAVFRARRELFMKKVRTNNGRNSAKDTRRV